MSIKIEIFSKLYFFIKTIYNVVIIKIGGKIIMKKFLIGLLVVVALIAVFCIGQYNGLVSRSENVDSKYADLDTMLQRRADLIPNLVSTVKGYTSHEDAIIDKITTARENLNKAKTVEEKSEANDQLSSALNSLMVVVENYPDLKASENFINLQDELAGTENRIAVARKDYNDSVKSYNTSIKKFPGSIFAGMFGFDSKAYFEAEESSKSVPNVSFE